MFFVFSSSTFDQTVKCGLRWIASFADRPPDLALGYQQNLVLVRMVTAGGDRWSGNAFCRVEEYLGTGVSMWTAFGARKWCMLSRS
jgi:hypothetical protein